MIELYDGRPVNTSGRAKKETAVYDLLDSLGTPGSVSVMGLMNDTENCVQLLIDEDILASELVGCHPCVNTSSLSFRVRDLIDVFLPAVGHSYITVRLSEEA